MSLFLNRQPVDFTISKDYGDHEQGQADPREGPNSRNETAAAKDARARARDRRGLDLDRYVPALITSSPTSCRAARRVFYQKRFGVNVTEWRILSLLAIEPGISAARICHVIGFDKGPVSRNLAVMEERGLVTIKADPSDGRTPCDHDDRRRDGRRTTRSSRCPRARTPPVVVPAEGRAGNADRTCCCGVHGNLDAVTGCSESRTAKPERSAAGAQ